MNNVCIVRNTFYDRSAFLQISIEYQEAIDESKDFHTYIFIDPHPEYGISDSYDDICNKHKLYTKIFLDSNKGKLSWYYSINSIFSTYSKYDYIISIEDDIILSRDYIRICKQLIYDGALDKEDNILMFHAGAWGRPNGDKNLIIRSSSSLRSTMISRKKFCKFIDTYYKDIDSSTIEGLDIDIKNILNKYRLSTICPQMNRHGHFGVYGWSSNGRHADNRGQSSIFENRLTHDKLYKKIKPICLNGNKLLELNQNKNPKYFWDFDPNINFTKLNYKL